MQKQTNEQENFPKKLIFYYFIDFSFEQKKSASFVIVITGSRNMLN